MRKVIVLVAFFACGLVCAQAPVSMNPEQVEYTPRVHSQAKKAVSQLLYMVAAVATVDMVSISLELLRMAGKVAK